MKRMPKVRKVDGVYYFNKSAEQMLLEELLEKLESKGVLKKADIVDIKAKAESKMVSKK